MDVQGDDEDHLRLSDSDGKDEKGEGKPPENDGSVNVTNWTSTLATTKVLFSNL